MDGLLLKYFVLRPKGIDAHGAASRAAMRAYAEHIRPFSSKLADELTMWADKEDAEAT